jgi:hypothetical protein
MAHALHFFTPSSARGLGRDQVEYRKGTMKNIFRMAALALVALGFSVNASAGLISFQSDVHQLHYIGNGQEKTYWHDLTDVGFIVDTHIAQSFDLLILLADDLDLAPETVSINVAAGSIDAQYGSFLNVILPSLAAYGSTFAQALLQITDTGMLSVKISSVYGDFYLGSSFLTVRAWASEGGGVAVPEPGTLALMLAALALAGFAFLRRRKLRAKL